MSKSDKTKKEAVEVVLKTKDIAAAMGITPKALRKQLRATEKFADHKYTNYRFKSVEEVKTLLAPAA